MKFSWFCKSWFTVLKLTEKVTKHIRLVTDLFTKKMWSKRFWTSNFATVLKVSTVLFKSNKFLETPGCRFPQEITESFLLGGKPAAEVASRENPQKITHVLPLDWQVFVTFLGWLRDPFKGLSDLQIGYRKVTLNHLVTAFLLVFSFTSFPTIPGSGFHG